tara:strand:+ start:275 stop:616 length:342 start_codon:yes stop_codon:yes gene_type:complete
LKKSNFSDRLRGALKGALITGGVGFGIPAAYGMYRNNLDDAALGTATRFGLASAVPGAILGAILTKPKNNNKLKHPKLYKSPEEDVFYRDLMNYYADPQTQLSEQDLVRLLSK